jgi:hypothetical protein
MEGLNRQYERRLHEKIPRLEKAVANGASDNALTDEVFEMLRLSRAAANSREVETWRESSQSPERMSAALKWALLAAEEAHYDAACHALWKQDYLRNQTSHHITDQEIQPPDLPDD